jgi:hypothetical protein
VLVFIFFPLLINSASTSTTSTPPIFPEAPEQPPLPLGGDGGLFFFDDFNSYNDGDLNGQGDWFGSADFDVQGITKYEGNKAILTTGDSTWIEATTTAQTSGIIGLYARQSVLTDYLQLYLYDNVSAIAGIQFDEAGRLRARNTTWFTLIDPYKVDTWYWIEMEWRDTDGQARFRATEAGDTPGAWSDWKGNNDIRDIFKVHLRHTRANGTAFYDYISDSPYVAPLELDVLIENASTGASFVIRNSISYGRIIIIFLLLLILVSEGIQSLIKFIIPQTINSKR